MKKVLSIIGYLLSVGFNIPHLVGAYFLTGDVGISSTLIWLTMFVLDFGILVLAINDKDVHTQIFAWVIFVLNLIYYWSGIPFPDSYSDWVSCLPGLLFSSIPAFFVYYFSELIAEQFRGSFKDDRELIDMFRVQIGELTVEIESNREVIDKYRATFESIAKIRGEKIAVSGVKATFCKCGSLIVAGSNKEASQKCNCGKTIDWHGR